MGDRVCPKVVALPGWAPKRPCWLEHSETAGMGAIPSRTSLPQCLSHEDEGAAETLIKMPPLGARANEMALVHPVVRSLIGSTNDEILGVAKDMKWGWYQVVLSVLPCMHQDQVVKELHWELSKRLTRAGLHDNTGPTRPLSRDRAHSWPWSQFWAQSHSVETSRRKSAKWQHGVFHDEALLAKVQMFAQQEQAAAAPGPVTGRSTTKCGTSLGFP